VVKPHINMKRLAKMIEEAIKDGARFLPKASAHRYGLLKKKQPVILELLERKAKALEGGDVLFLGLTYRDGEGPKPGDVSAFVAKISERGRRRGTKIPLVWKQERGQNSTKRQHYHAIILLPPGVAIKPETLQGWWPHGAIDIGVDKTEKECVKSIANYVTKADESISDLSRGLKLLGLSGFEASEREDVRWATLPYWVQLWFDRKDQPVKAKGGGYMSKRTGEVMPSPWTMAPKEGIKFCPGKAWTESERGRNVLEQLIAWGIKHQMKGARKWGFLDPDRKKVPPLPLTSSQSIRHNPLDIPPHAPSSTSPTHPPRTHMPLMKKVRLAVVRAFRRPRPKVEGRPWLVP